MNISRIASALLAIVVIVASLAIILRVQFVRALADASSTAATTSEATSPDSSASTSSSSTTASPDVATSTEPTLVPAPAAPANQAALTLVHIAGTKYVDYCTDGTTTTAYPGDPSIDAHFNVPDAATPKCPEGMTWDHTSGMDKYDTATGDLDVGDYVQQSDGAYLIHYPASTYTDATSTSDWPDRIVTTRTNPAPAAPAQVSDAVASTTTSASSTEIDASSTPIQ